jgi:glycosyltransferase involved in cell wall biosynthesis
MTNIFILNGRNPYKSRGGAATWILNILPYFEQDFKVNLIFIPDRWLKVKFIPDRIKAVFFTIYICMFYIRKNSIVFSHSPEMGYIASFFTKKLIHLSHGNTNPVEKPTYKIGKLFKWVFNLMDKRLIKKSLLYYTVGEPLKHKKFISQPILKPTDIKIKSNEERKNIIFAGRLEKVKNIEKLIKIYNFLPEKIKNENQLIICGTGSLFNKLKETVEQLNLKNNIVFKGHLAYHDVLEEISKAKLMVMASEFEGFPMSIAEALSFGTPVVSSDVGSIATVIKNGYNGYCLNKDDPESIFAQKWLEILTDFEKFSFNALESSKVFNPENIYSEIISDFKLKGIL